MEGKFSMKVMLLRLIGVTFLIQLFAQASQSPASGMVAYYGYPGVGGNATLIRGFFSSKKPVVSVLELENDVLDNQLQAVLCIIDPQVKMVCLRGTCEIGCNIVFPNGSKDCLVVCEATSTFTGNVLNGEISGHILSPKESSCC